VKAAVPRLQLKRFAKRKTALQAVFSAERFENCPVAVSRVKKSQTCTFVTYYAVFQK